MSDDDILVQADLIRQRRYAEREAEKAAKEAEKRRQAEERRRAKIMQHYEELLPFEPIVVEGEIYDSEDDSDWSLFSVAEIADALENVGEGQWVRVTIELLPPRFNS